MKRQVIRKWVLALCAGLLAAAGASAANGSLDPAQTEHISIAPFSIPVGPGGTTDIGMTRLGLRTAANGDTTSVSSITVQAISSGTFSDNWVTAIRVYFEVEGLEGEYFHGGTPVDARTDSGTNAFSGGIATIALNPTIAKFTRPGGALNYFYVVVDLAGPGTVDTSTTLGVRVTNVRYGLPDVGDTADYAPPALAVTRNLDDYETTLDVSYIGPASAAANAAKVPVLRLDFDVADATTTSNVDSIKVHRIYGLDNYATTVFLYDDVNGNGSYEPSPGADGDPIASAALSSSFATLNPTSVLPVTSAGKTYFVAVDMDGTNAQVGQYFGLNVDNPSTDIVFVDEIQDDNDLIPTEYAYVPGNDSGLYEYLQLGFINSTTADPVVDPANRFLINPPNDGQPPQVATTVPLNGATGVSRNADITVLFNEYMTESSVENPANFTLTGGVTPITKTFTYTASTQTLLIGLSALDWDATYTATVKYTVEDFYGNPMGVAASSDYTWTFTVEPAVNPTVLAVVPEEDGTDVAVESATTTIRATFSEPLEATTVGAGDLTLALANAPFTAVPGTVSYDAGTQTVVLTLGAELANDTLYRATVPASSVTDQDDLPLLAEKTWTFRTIRLYPPFTEPVIIKNRIVTGGNQQALVFVTEPPGGPADRVSVQVFTNTGRRVATLVDNLPFTSISSPIAWDGTNGKGQPLGPGLYYVQIRATKYKRVLKVLIVR